MSTSQAEQSGTSASPPHPPSSLPDQMGAVVALVFLLVATAVWWALALWPVSDSPPEWLGRVRWVCFNARPDGLPDASGWLLLIGQPIGMAVLLLAIWGDALRLGLATMVGSTPGKVLVVICSSSLALGIGAATVRLAEQSAVETVFLPGDMLPTDTYPRLDRIAPPLALIDQQGGVFDLDSLLGQPVLVTFAFGNCHTVCPVIVKQTLDVQEHAREKAVASGNPLTSVPHVLIVSLDPWRDTPSRLSHLAKHWGVERDGTVLSGSVAQVESALDDWNVARRRDETTGDVAHPPLVYILDAEGKIVYASAGGVESMLELLDRV